MTTTAAPVDVPAEALELHEGARSAPTPIDESGRVLVHIIRPCIGRGRGQHLYSPSMLQEAAPQFAGWPMFMDHLSPEARKAAGGLPRSTKDVGGIVEESWWDPNVPADAAKGFGQGAVVGYARPFGLAKDLIEHDPRLVEASISANATGVRPVRDLTEASRLIGVRLQEGSRRGRIWDVAGIAEGGSVDWVTQAGAGGKVVALMEARTDEDEADLMEAIEGLDFTTYLDRERPGLAEALRANDDPPKEGNMGDTITPDVLQEALQSEAVQEWLNPIIDQRATAIAEAQVQEKLPTLVEEAVASERDLIRAEAEASANRRVDLRDMRDEAHKLIDEAKMPDSWKAALKGRFDLQENGDPTADLDVVDAVDEESGEVTKSARAVLRESVAEAVKEQTKLLQEARPTRVRGLGPAKPVEGGDSDGKLQEGEKKYEGTLVGSLLQEANIDPDTAWSGQRA
jgi:hypothetical protein